MGDCHLGGWRQPELSALNLASFEYACNKCIKEKLDFVLIAGDFFDSAYPSIEAIKSAFKQFRKLKEANIPVFLIAGSHDYSVSGRTFLDVLEEAGFAKNVFVSEEKNGSIYLYPTIFKNVAIYGYPGKKSGMEVPDIARIKLHDAPGLFRILMLHTAIRDAVGNLPIPAVAQDQLPKVDYVALAHLHVNYNKNGRVSSEMEELQGGSFYIVDTNGKIERQEVKLKQVIIVDVEIKNALQATDLIQSRLNSEILEDKIVILRLSGFIESGKTTDIKFADIELVAKKKGAYVLLKNISKLHAKESEIRISAPPEDLEETIIEKFKQENKNYFNRHISPLISVFQQEKKEDEKTQVFEERLILDMKRLTEI
jgi:hypothetical protein